MKKSFIFLIGMCFYLPFAEAQTQTVPFARHYWLNPQSVNYTLSPPTTDGNWMLAAARNEEGIAKKNTIAVFKLDNLYNIVSTGSGAYTDAHVIGLPPTTSTCRFDTTVEFEAHCIVQSAIPDDNYVICGSLKRGNAQKCGMVIVLDANLNIVSLQEFEDVETFYSAYMERGYYYVCGNMNNNNNRGGIVLQSVPGSTVSVSFITTTAWTYDKIRVRTNPGSGMFTVSGSGFDNMGRREIGAIIFDIQGGGGNFSTLSRFKFNPNHAINSKVVVSNYPGTGGMGLVLSVSDNQTIYTYLVNDYSQQQPPRINTAFEIPIGENILLEDIDCGSGQSTIDPQIAWVGNYPQQSAYYIHMDMRATTGPPMPSTNVALTIFDPSPTANTYYSLHKVHFYKKNGGGSGDDFFHAGGYYKHSDGDKTTFVVTPDDPNVIEKKDCVGRGERRVHDMSIPATQTPSQSIRCYPANVFDLIAVKYIFCTSEDCEIDNCRNTLSPEEVKIKVINE